MYTFEERSELPNVAAGDVWARVSSWEGVNDELGPWVYMTHPAEFPSLQDIPVDGRSHLTSVILLLGVLPTELHWLALRELEPGRFFDEVSSNVTMRAWHHRRELREIPGAVEVVDRCGIVPRLSVLGPPLLAIYRRVFRHRHRRLRAYFEGVGRASP